MAYYDTNGYLYCNTGISVKNRPLFSSTTERENYFSRYRNNAFHFEHYSYVRASNIISLHNTKEYYEKMPNGYAPGSVTINASIEQLNGYDYLEFQNNDFSSRKYYGFVEYVEYINESTTRVWFSIDWFATYQFDINIVSGFVEREHMHPQEEWIYDQSSQTYFPNYENANLYESDFGCNETINLEIPDEDILRPDLTEDFSSKNQSPKKFVAYYLPTESINSPNDYYVLEGFAGTPFPHACVKGDTVVELAQNMKLALQDNQSIYGTGSLAKVTQIPEFLFGKEEAYPTIGQQVPTNSINNIIDIDFMFVSPFKDDDVLSYLADPKITNAKLFTSQYMVSHIIGWDKDIKIPPEKSISVNIQNITRGTHLIRFLGTGSIHPSLIISAYLYDTSGVKQSLNLGDVALTESFPDIPAIKNGAEMAMFQNGGRLTMNLLQGIKESLSPARLMNGASKGGMAGAVAEGIEAGTDVGLSLTNYYAMKSDLMHTPSTLINGSSNALISSVRKLFNFYYVIPRKEEYDRLNKLFNCYGYSVNEVKDINLHTRPYWNYIKASDVIIRGSATAEAIKYTQNMLGNGVRFWHGDNLANGSSTIGDYSNDNSGI